MTEHERQTLAVMGYHFLNNETLYAGSTIRVARAEDGSNPASIKAVDFALNLDCKAINLLDEWHHESRLFSVGDFNVNKRFKLVHQEYRNEFENVEYSSSEIVGMERYGEFKIYLHSNYRNIVKIKDPENLGSDKTVFTYKVGN